MCTCATKKNASFYIYSKHIFNASYNCLYIKILNVHIKSLIKRGGYSVNNNNFVFSIPVYLYSIYNKDYVTINCPCTISLSQS